MRRRKLVAWVIISLAASIFLRAPLSDFSDFPLKRTSKIYRVAVLPICNPGSLCNPKTPKKLDHSFFFHPNGVRSFIRSISHGHAALSGFTTSWLKPKQKLRSAEEMINRVDELINLASDQIVFSEFDFFFLYINVNGSEQKEISWPPGQIVSMASGDIHPGLAFMINSDIYHSPEMGSLSSAILPSTSWAIEFLQMAGLKEKAHMLSCKEESRIGSCDMRYARDPFSVVGEKTFSLMLNWSMKRSLSWSFESEILRVNKNGIYRLDVDDESAPKALEILMPKSLKLNDTISFDRVFIEQKMSTNFERTIKKLQNKELLNRVSSTLEQHDNGAFLYFAQNRNGVERTASIDTKSGLASSSAKKGRTSYLVEMADAPMTLGQNFKVFESPLTLKLLGATSRSLTIKVDGLGN